jgi:integrative and conjugative element protein (TIGR02256 family)
MREEAVRWRPLESGGLLVGYRVNEHEAVLSEIVGPGPAALHRPDGFRPDTRYQELELERRFKRSGGAMTYLGDWHTHPGQPGVPSRKDRRTLRRIARTKDAACPLPLMVILGEEDDEWVVEGWQAHVRWLARLHVRAARLRLWDPAADQT